MDAGVRSSARYSPPMADSPDASARLPRLIAFPLVLGIVAALALLIFAELGYQRLESAAQRVAAANVAARSHCANPVG